VIDSETDPFDNKTQAEIEPFLFVIYTEEREPIVLWDNNYLSLIKRLLAALTFDSSQMTPALGVRAGAAAGRQLLFSAGDSELHLQIAPAGEQWQITGQVLGPCAGGSVELRGANETLNAALNELCEFTLAPLAAGVYALALRLGDVELEIPELEIGRS